MSFLTVSLKDVFCNIREQTKKEEDRIQEKNQKRRKVKRIPRMIVGGGGDPRNDPKHNP